jgi:hypothetical protein
MKSKNYLVLLTGFLIISSCITQFVPETEEEDTMLVVEGILTDQPGGCTVKLSKSLPLSAETSTEVLSGCTVVVSDDLGNWVNLYETKPGTYVSGGLFRGYVGRKYKLHVNTNNPDMAYKSYESLSMEMKPVPVIDSLYYNKIDTEVAPDGRIKEQECQIFLNTADPDGICKHYRWDYSETWMFRLPYDVPNRTCWITNNSNSIFIKNTSVLAEDIIDKFPIQYVSAQTDRLSQRYSLLVNQYSLNEDEFNYWEKLQNVTENVGSLYDITPVSISGNIYCVEEPKEQVLGYFSVSSVTSKRIFIEDSFKGLVRLYDECPTDTVYGGQPAPEGLGISYWLIIDNSFDINNPYKVYTMTKGCADCTIRGTNVEPSFWREEE